MNGQQNIKFLINAIILLLSAHAHFSISLTQRELLKCFCLNVSA